MLFLALGGVASWLEQIATQSIPQIETALMVQSGISLLIAAVMYVVTAQIMEKKLSV